MKSQLILRMILVHSEVDKNTKINEMRMKARILIRRKKQFDSELGRFQNKSHVWELFLVLRANILDFMSSVAGQNRLPRTNNLYECSRYYMST